MSPPAVFHIFFTPPQKAQQTLTFKTFDLTAKAGKDYVANSGTLNIAPGSTQATVVVQIIGNLIHQRNRKFGLEVDGVDRVAYGIATIIDDDPKPSHIRVSNPKVFEGNVGNPTVTMPTTPTTPTPPISIPSTPNVPIPSA